MFSQVSVCLSTIGFMDTGSLLGLVTARSVSILLECFLVFNSFTFDTNQYSISKEIQSNYLEFPELPDNQLHFYQQVLPFPLHGRFCYLP